MKFSIATVAAIAGLVAADGWEQWASTTPTDPDSTWLKWTTTSSTRPSRPTSYDPNWSEWESTTVDPAWSEWSTSADPVDPATTWGEWDTSVTYDHHHGFPGHKTVTYEDPSKTWAGWSKVTDPAESTVDYDWSEWSTETEKPHAWTTTVVTAITTFCPKQTTITHAGKTYTVEASHTLTVTDCPCTISVPVWTKTSTSCDPEKTPDSETGVSSWSAWVPGVSTLTSKTPDAASGTWSEWQTPSATNKVPIATWTGAASRNAAAGLAGVAGLAALLL